MATKEVYQARCGACGHVLGEVAEPNAPIDSTCEKCGVQKMAVIKTIIRERTALDYNVYVSCKQTNATLKDGFTIGIEDLVSKTPEEIKNIFVESCAQSLISMFNRENVGKMVVEAD